MNTGADKASAGHDAAAFRIREEMTALRDSPFGMAALSSSYWLFHYTLAP